MPPPAPLSVQSELQVWKDTPSNPDWEPTLLRCGPYDEHLTAFPVKSGDGDHFLWIPPEAKFGLRLMNRVIYALWHLSRSPAFPEDSRRRVPARIGEYTDQRLRSGVFDEVLAYWYPPGTRLPTQEKPIPQSDPFRSAYLDYFLSMMYDQGTPVPATDGREPAVQYPSQFDWEAWAERRVPNRILFGRLPSRDKDAYKRLREESLRAGIPVAPSVEIDRKSWARYTAAICEEIRDYKSRSGSGAVKESGGYVLQLDQTRLLFIPDQPVGPTGTVVQVLIQSHGDRDVSKVFSANQATLTSTIETLLVGHVNALSKLPEYVTVKDVVPGYELVGTRRPWQYGADKKFYLGDTRLQPAKDKWVFRLEKSK